ncbi:MAG TPA: hypothetical protein VKP65_08630 [Rhodothermales bacterium]|nr:hypothetical protein [Rhodothermales bacterium]
MSYPLPTRSVLIILIGLCLSMAACAPSLSPLYRDYEAQTDSSSAAPIDERIETALTDAGWHLKSAAAPNAFATEERKLSSWGLYSVVASVEVVPLGTEYVRLYIHPYRKYITGGRGKIPYLNKSLQRSVLKDLTRAFEQQGLQAIGTGEKRDEALTAR